MRLLVSVSDAEEAAAALAGGADIIDAKNPEAGALGAVAIDVLRRIDDAIRGVRLLTAALGDTGDEAAVELAASAAASAGARLVKIGVAGASATRAVALLQAAIRGAAAGSRDCCGVVAVAYADGDHEGLSPDALVDAAAAAGTTGVLLDTANKNGPRLPALLSHEALSAWVARGHENGLMVALAGRLRMDDMTFVRDAGADVAGVRGAACEGGRTGRISYERVRALRGALAQRDDAH